MSRKPALAYGMASHLLFLAVFLDAVGFVGDLPVARSIDSGPGSPFWSAVPGRRSPARQSRPPLTGVDLAANPIAPVDFPLRESSHNAWPRTV